MKNSNLLIASLILVICFLIYQVFDLKQEMRSVGLAMKMVSGYIKMMIRSFIFLITIQKLKKSQRFKKSIYDQ